MVGWKDIRKICLRLAAVVNFSTLACKVQTRCLFVNIIDSSRVLINGAVCVCMINVFFRDNFFFDCGAFNVLLVALFFEEIYLHR